MVHRMDASIADEAEAYVRGLLSEWLDPDPGECLACYLDRALERHRCAGDLALAEHYRDVAAPRATALVERLESMGGFCDCEVLCNALQPAWHLWSTSREIEIDGREIVLEAEPPPSMPPCTGVRRGSTQPCRNWHTMRRPARYRGR